MLSSISVKRFRCFRDLDLSGLARINLIAGRNNVGKSSLLEAVCLHCLPDKPNLWIKVYKLRGVEDPLESIDELADWLFFEGNRESPIEIQSIDNKGDVRATLLHLVDAPTSRRKFPDIEDTLAHSLLVLAASDVNRLILQYSFNNGDLASSVLSAGKLPNASHVTLETPAQGKILSQFLPSFAGDEDREIRNFGILEKTKRLDEVIPPLHHLEPRLRRLALVPFAGKSRIHGDLDEFKQLVPLPQLGEGIRRLLSILLAVAVVPGGIVLIDEIENGLHYSVQTQVWSAIAQAARQHDVQIFATTHSWECLRYAHDAYCDDEADDFRLHRLDRVHGDITATTYDRDGIDAALAMGVEVR
jgi:AAA domain, putative AbiEii toxin, Type IV TA system